MNRFPVVALAALGLVIFQAQGQTPPPTADPYANNPDAGKLQFPLAAPAGKDSGAITKALPGAVNQGMLDPAKWKYGPAFDAPPSRHRATLLEPAAPHEAPKVSVQIERIAHVLEMQRRVRVIVHQPRLRLAEPPTPFFALGEEMTLVGTDGVLQEGDHEASERLVIAGGRLEDL